MLPILRSTTFLAPISLAFLSSGAAAQLTISTDTTVPVRTSTAASGGPAAISVTKDGSITLSSGSAITVDSDHNVTNEGDLELGGSNGATGIDVTGSRSSTIVNRGSIKVTEKFVASNPDGNTIVDGPVASASDRAGIRVRGPLTGNIENSGSILVEGLNSAGIRVDDRLQGSLSSSGEITVIGDYSTGIRTGDVTGNVSVDGKIAVVGEGARAVDITGDIGGSLRLQNTIGQQVTYVNDDGVTMSLGRSDLRVGAPAVAIAGNVAGGIIVATQPTLSSTDTDTDDDGIPDANEGKGLIQSFGNGPAIQIGGTSDIVIGTYGNRGHSLVIDGTVEASGHYTNIDAVGIAIGGQGGAVTMANGISVSGTVKATTQNATATAILINQGSVVPVIDNSGTISAVITSSGEGATYAIRDLSGTLTTINNSGYISANGTAEDTVVAIDVSANSSGVTINQQRKDGESADDATINKQITGAILTGAGNDRLLIGDGAVVGNASLGAGDDLVNLTGDAIYKGNIDFGSGTATMSLVDKASFAGTAAFNDQASTLTLSGNALFSGAVSGGSRLAVNVNGGTLQASGSNDLNFASLHVGSKGTIKVAIDGETRTNPKFNVGTASFEDGARIAASIDRLGNVEGRYLILTADTLIGTPTFSNDDTVLPYLFKGAVTVDQAAGEIMLDIALKTASDLGLNRNQSAAYAAILAAAPKDEEVEDSLLGIANGETLSSQFNSLLPDHAGGNFDLLTRGSRLAGRHLSNDNTMFDISNVGGWFEPLKWGGSKDQTASAGYTTSGWGLSGGLEKVTGIGNVGGSITWLNGSNKNDAHGNKVDANAYELGAFWRMHKGGLYAFARASFAFASFSGSRVFTGKVGDETVTRTAVADWDGQMYSATGGVSYAFDIGNRVSLKPMATVDYYRLKEDGYAEKDGGDAVNLTVAGRTSDALFANTTMTAIYRFGDRVADGRPLTLEVEGGRRNRVGGGLGNTTAHFKDGNDFTLTPDRLKGGWIGEVRLLSGGMDYTWTVSGSAEQTQGDPAYGIRLSLGAAF